MNEMDMLHGRDWGGESLDGWSVSEKMDGVRAYWDGRDLWTRSGRRIDPPGWMADRLPDGVHLDCEIWGGRGRFGDATAAANRGDWRPGIRLVAFDCPSAAGDWESRMAVARGCYLDCVTSETLTRSQIAARLSEILATGGEGLVARRPGTQYHTGRSSSVLKLKAAAVGKI